MYLALKILISLFYLRQSSKKLLAFISSCSSYNDWQRSKFPPPPWIKSKKVYDLVWFIIVWFWWNWARLALQGKGFSSTYIHRIRHYLLFYETNNYRVQIKKPKIQIFVDTLNSTYLHWIFNLVSATRGVCCTDGLLALHSRSLPLLTILGSNTSSLIVMLPSSE